MLTFTGPIARLSTAVFLALTLAQACSHSDSPSPTAAPSSSRPKKPVDRLEPGELPEGTLSAFDLKLPRGMKIRTRGPFEILAEGRLPAEAVSNYVRKRIKAETIELGAARTVFNQALVLGESQRRVEVAVISFGHTTRLVIRDLTPVKIEPGLSDEERWGRFGFTKDGQLIDPLHMD